jgi:TRAP-type C4-dicarboxylate transport system permease small subunit
MKTFHSRLNYFLEVLVCLSFLSFFGMVILLVGLRYLFNSSITGANEIITILFVYTTAIGAAIAVGQRGHIAINILIEKLPQRLAKHLIKLQLALVGLINFAIAWFSVPWISQTGDNLMPTLGAMRAVVQISIPLGCGLAVLYCIITAIAGLEEIKTGDAAQLQVSSHPRDQDHSA